MRDLEWQLRTYGGVLDRAEPALADMADARPRPMRRTLIVAVAAAVVIAVSAVAVAITATGSGNAHRPAVITPPSTDRSPVTAAPGTVSVLAIGDSVMEGAKGPLQAEMPGIAVDAVKSRQFAQALAVVQVYRAAGVLPNRLVVALGTNGEVSATELDALLRAVGDRQVYFVTVRVPRVWESEVNDQIRALPARWPNAHVIDWHEFAGAHIDWFVQDGFHVTTAGQQAYASLIASALGLLSKSTPNPPSGLKVVAFDEDGLPSAQLAVAGDAVWIATRVITDTSSVVRLERRDPTTTKVVETIDVHQETVFAIAGDGDTLWIAGGGDGGVPDTTVSRVDVRTKTVVFTKTLNGTPCACPIVAGSAGVWLVGNGSDDAIRLSTDQGRVLAVVRLPSKARDAIETRDRLLVGLDDGSVARIDPATNRVDGLVSTQGTPSTAPVTAMASPPLANSPIAGFVTHADGQTFAILTSTGQANQFLKLPFVPTTVADLGGVMWAFGGDRLQMQATAGERPKELAYDSARHEFVEVTQSSATQVQGFRNAVSVGGRVWVVYDPADGQSAPSIVVIDAPAVHEG